MTNETTGRPSTPSLFADALSQITSLFETEIRLVRTELGEKISMAVQAVVVLLVAAVLLLAALFLLLIGFVELLVSYGFVPWQAYFAVGAGISLCAGLALLVALRRLSVERMMPKRALAQFGKDAEIVREQVQ